MNYNPYSPYGMTPVSAPVLPPQQVIQVNGEQGVRNLRMSPNSSVIVVDTTASRIWYCVSDGIGNVTPMPWRVSPWEDALAEPPAPVEPKADWGEDIAQIKAELQSIFDVCIMNLSRNCRPEELRTFNRSD